MNTLDKRPCVSVLIYKRNKVRPRLLGKPHSTYLYISSNETSLTSPFSASSIRPFVKPPFEKI